MLTTTLEWKRIDLVLKAIKVNLDKILWLRVQYMTEPEPEAPMTIRPEDLRYPLEVDEDAPTPDQKATAWVERLKGVCEEAAFGVYDQNVLFKVWIYGVKDDGKGDIQNIRFGLVQSRAVPKEDPLPGLGLPPSLQGTVLDLTLHAVAAARQVMTEAEAHRRLLQAENVKSFQHVITIYKEIVGMKDEEIKELRQKLNEAAQSQQDDLKEQRKQLHDARVEVATIERNGRLAQQGMTELANGVRAFLSAKYGALANIPPELQEAISDPDAMEMINDPDFSREIANQIKDAKSMYKQYKEKAANASQHPPK